MTPMAPAHPARGGRVIATLGGIALAALLLTGCASRLPTQQTLTIAPDPVPCGDGVPGACLRVTGPKGDVWIMGRDEIEGFTYEPGFTYELLVEEPSVVSEEEAPAPIRLALIRVVSKRPAGQSERASADQLGERQWVLANVVPSGHDPAAWAASGITAEFDLAAGRMSGFAGCNNYAAALSVTSEHFQISQPAATRKACASQTTMALEQEYLTRLAGTTAFAIRGEQLDLSLADGSGLEFHAASD